VTVDALTSWLAALSAPELAEVLRRRCDILEAPPADLAELAEALLAPGSLRQLVRRLNRPQLQLIDALSALPEDTGLRQLGELVGRAPQDPQFRAVLDELAAMAAVVITDEMISAPDELRTIFPHPLGLGAPAAVLLGGEPAVMLKRLAAYHGLGNAPTKAAALAAILPWYADGEAIRAAVSGLPSSSRELLHELAWRGPIAVVQTSFGPFGNRLPDEIDWAAGIGLLVRRGPWGNEFELPAEVGLALRGAGWHAPFDPVPPAVPAGDARSADQAEQSAAAAATAVLDQVTALLAECAASPPALKKAGGITARDLKRLAKLLGIDAAQLVLLLQLCAAGHLVAGEETSLLVTDKYDAWLASEPAHRLATIIRAWWNAPVVPTYTAGEDAPTTAQLPIIGGGPRRLRSELVARFAAVPLGRSASLSDILAAVGWHAPLAVLATVDPAGLAAATVAEAELLGVVAAVRRSGPDGPMMSAATGIARSLIAAPETVELLDDPLVVALRSALPAAEGTAIFQADLTAVVAGVPAAELAAVLDAAATRESRGHATTWRFTAASVRSALDNGWTANALTEALAGYAREGGLPQALRYLIGDVGRQHGRIAVRAFGCVLVLADEGLAAELRAAVGLRKLGLAPLGPGLLGAAAPVHRVLEMLRANGYAPVEQDDTGHVVIDRAPVRRAASADIVDKLARSLPPGRRPAPARVSTPSDATTVAKALIKVGLPRPPVPVKALPGNVIQLVPAMARGGVATAPARAIHDVDEEYLALEQFTPKLAPNERRLLWKALGEGTPIRVTYQDANGSRTNRTIEPTELLGRVLVAYCHLRQDERNFALDRISSVRLG
jgi:hypothetical protein